MTGTLKTEEVARVRGAEDDAVEMRKRQDDTGNGRRYEKRDSKHSSKIA